MNMQPFEEENNCLHSAFYTYKKMFKTKQIKMYTY